MNQSAVPSYPIYPSLGAYDTDFTPCPDWIDSRCISKTNPPLILPIRHGTRPKRMLIRWWSFTFLEHLFPQSIIFPSQSLHFSSKRDCRIHHLTLYAGWESASSPTSLLCWCRTRWHSSLLTEVIQDITFALLFVEQSKMTRVTQCRKAES